MIDQCINVCSIPCGMIKFYLPIAIILLILLIVAALYLIKQYRKL